MEGIFFCEKCDFHSTRKINFYDHLKTKKHKSNHSIIKQSNKKFMCICNKYYTNRFSLYKHKSKCLLYKNNEEQLDDKKEDFQEPLNQIKVLQNQNNELREQNEELKDQNIMLKKIMIELKNNKEEIIEIIKSNSQQNIINNQQITNNHFNIQIFLNEKCKDALNVEEFIQLLQLNIDTLKENGRLGYAEGMTNVFMKALNKIEITKRPIHCTDIKRETIYIKEKNKWEKDDPDNKLLKYMLDAVDVLHHKQFAIWENTNAKLNEIGSNEYEMGIKVMINLLCNEKSKKSFMKHFLPHIYLHKEKVKYI